jgi:Serine hydroxymethyltransferase
MNPSGLRIGTPALTTRGLVEEDMREIARIIAVALGEDFLAEREALLERSRALMEKYPLYSAASASSSTGSAPSSGASTPSTRPSWL